MASIASPFADHSARHHESEADLGLSSTIVSSLMNTFGQKLQHSATPSPSPSPQPPEKATPNAIAASSQQFSSDPYGPAPVTPPRTRTDREKTDRSSSRPSSRPGSMLFPLPAMDIGGDTIPELQPIFRFLNSHANKLYQEGYFLKLNDLDISQYLTDYMIFSSRLIAL